jgi:hypothetical protein
VPSGDRNHLPKSRFELRKDDAEVVVQIASGDVLWQKERLLNMMSFAHAGGPADKMS